MSPGARTRRIACAFAALLLAACAGAPPPGGLQFGLIGDTPYGETEAFHLDGVIDEMNAAPLALIVHVGDITSGRGPCTDAWFEARKAQFSRWRAPWVLLPGDNDWTDCHRSGFDPLERLARWRRLFCVDPAGLAVERQRGPYCEHVRWEIDGVVFVALNVPGSNNNLGRTPQMDAEHASRMRAVLEWLDDSAARARRGMVILMHANPDFEGRVRRRAGTADGYAALRDRLASLPRPVLLVHGDTHLRRDDAPLPALRRIEVPGSPQLGWVRGTLLEGAFWFD